jgi:hypothetical protein
VTDWATIDSFADRHWMDLEGGRAAVEFIDDVVNLAMLVRNVGNGMAVIEAWQPFAGQLTSADEWGKLEKFRPQFRALLVPPGDVAFGQGALRDPAESAYVPIRDAVSEGSVSGDLLDRDHEGGQRTISRLSMIRRDDSEGG